eukprot:gene13344-biopygen6508
MKSPAPKAPGFSTKWTPGIRFPSALPLSKGEGVVRQLLGAAWQTSAKHWLEPCGLGKTAAGARQWMRARRCVPETRGESFPIPQEANPEYST